MRRMILGLLLVASLLAPEAQSYAQMDKLSLEALTAPSAGGSGGYAPARRRAARGHYGRQAPRAYRYRAYRAYRYQGYRHRAARGYRSPALRRYGRYGHALRRPQAALPGRYHGQRPGSRLYRPPHGRR